MSLLHLVALCEAQLVYQSISSCTMDIGDVAGLAPAVISHPVAADLCLPFWGRWDPAVPGCRTSSLCQ